MIRLLVAVGFVMLAGCGQTRINATDAKALKAELERVAKTLDKAKAAEFTKAADVVMFHAMMSDPDPKNKGESLFTAINGKTPDEIIEAYKQLGPQLQMELGGGIAKARKAANDLKEANDFREAAMNAEEKLRSDPATKDDVFLSDALFTINRMFDEKRSSDGYLVAAKWMSDQLKKSPEKIKEEFGLDSPNAPKLP